MLVRASKLVPSATLELQAMVVFTSEHFIYQAPLENSVAFSNVTVLVSMESKMKHSMIQLKFSVIFTQTNGLLRPIMIATLLINENTFFKKAFLAEALKAI